MYAESSQPEVRRLAAELFADKRNYLLSIARRNALNETDAEEALQETFANFIRAFDPSGGAPPLAWLTLALKRQCWRQRREAHLELRAVESSERSPREAGFLIESLSAGPEGTEERVVKADEARFRLVQLKRDERRALVLKAAGYSYGEIGKRYGWTYTKVNRCLSEGRAALRAQAAG
jgi:RNA polymerase sigma factor (sigma-70 family)